MLLQFSVENFQSIKNKVILSLEPNVDKEHPENIVEKKKYQALSTAIIYGANASGKTTIFKALTVALNLIRTSSNVQINNQIPVTPFAFDEDSINKPTSFEFTFVAKNNKKYIYGFSAFSQEVVEEYLYVYNTAKPSLIFDRTSTDSYKFARQYKAEMDLVLQRNTPNKLFICTATTWNVEATRPAFEWLSSGMDTFTNINIIQNAALDYYRNEKNGEFTSFTQKLMKYADINISSIDVQAKEITQQMLEQNPFGFLFNYSNSPKQFEYKIYTGHTIKKEDGSQKEYQLRLGEESVGTQQLFIYGPILKNAFDFGKTVMIDEIDRSLHPYIVKFLINLFRDSKINKNGAQLIATTHETALLSLDTLRRDQIYFTEKNQETGETDLYSLDEFSVRKTDNIERGYLLGRYGAIPYPYTEDII